MKEKNILKNNKVAILLSAFNGEKWIRAQINSILCQKNVDFTIFISVDISTDKTYYLCKQLEKSNSSKLTVLPYGEQFGGAAKNFFRLIRDVNIQNFDFVAFSDQDDIWLSNKLSHAINTINNTNADAFSSDVIAFWDSGKEKLIKKSFAQKKYDYLFESAGPGCTYVITSESFFYFKEFLCKNWENSSQIKLHDWLIYSYFRHNGLNWHIDNNPSIRYRQHTSNQVGSNIGFKAYFKRFFLVKNNWYRNDVEKINKLLKTRIQLSFFFRVRNFWQLRRRPRDALILLAFSLLGLY